MKLQEIAPDLQRQKKSKKYNIILFSILAFTLVNIWYFMTKVERVPFPKDKFEQLEKEVQFKLEWKVVGFFDKVVEIKSDRTDILIINESKESVTIDEKDVGDDIKVHDIINKYIQLKQENRRFLYNLLVFNTNEDKVIIKNNMDNQNYNILDQPSWIFLIPKETSSVQLQNLIKQHIAKISNFLLQDNNNENTSVNTSLNFNDNYLLTFTLLYGNPPDKVNDQLLIEMEKLILEHFTPYTKLLSPYISFNITLQIQYYAPLTITPILDPTNDYYIITNEQLPHFINSGEWDLKSSISLNPEIHFLFYLPDEKFNPMSFESKQSNILIPQWGGITLLNKQNNNKNTEINKQQLTKAIQYQLINFFNLIQFNKQYGITLAYHQFIYNKINYCLTKSYHSIQSLQQLIPTIPDMPVKQKIIDLAIKAIQFHQFTFQNIQNNFIELGFLNSIKSFKYADLAFFHKDMISVLYFPFDHSYALFLPLLLPTFTPIIMAIIKAKLKNKKQKIKKE
ncbi:hypothetical protein K502DRAFT_305574 [Neoconidiobolus thromboides FSU 785]|nr:hypothetical protein K502DRAFT_305574 [Neoconidiobolus thromboides FSU 785]